MLAHTSSSGIPSTAWAELYELEVTEPLRRTQGRETFHWHPPEAGEPSWIVKRFTPARGLRLWSQLGRSQAEREHENLLGLERAGIPVPRALGWSRERASGSFAPRRSLVVMEYVEHAETLGERLASADPSERRRLAERVLAIVARMHRARWYHRDLYVVHFVLRSSDDALVLLDAGRARHERRPRVRWFVKDLAALHHSAPSAVTASERLRFAARWLDFLGILGRGPRRRWIRAIEKKRARMAAHVPRDERALAR